MGLEEESCSSVPKPRSNPFVILLNYRGRRRVPEHDHEESCHQGYQHSCGSYSDTEQLQLQTYYRQAAQSHCSS